MKDFWRTVIVAVLAVVLSKGLAYLAGDATAMEETILFMILFLFMRKDTE